MANKLLLHSSAALSTSSPDASPPVVGTLCLFIFASTPSPVCVLCSLWCSPGPLAPPSALSHVCKLCIPELTMTLMEINLKSSVYPSLAVRLFSCAFASFAPVWYSALIFLHSLLSNTPKCTVQESGLGVIFHVLVTLLLLTHKVLFLQRIGS